MIEAVNSVLSNASSTRVVAEQQSTVRSYAANPDKTQEVARTPYISPYISIDRQSNRAVLQIRDSDTGDVKTQYPTEGQLKAYQAAQSAEARTERAEANTVSTPQVADVEVPSVETTTTTEAAPVSIDTEA